MKNHFRRFHYGVFQGSSFLRPAFRLLRPRNAVGKHHHIHNLSLWYHFCGKILGRLRNAPRKIGSSVVVGHRTDGLANNAVRGKIFLQYLKPIPEACQNHLHGLLLLAKQIIRKSDNLLLIFDH